MKRGKYIQFGVIVAALALIITANETIGAFGQGIAEFDSIKIGQQGVGGVTYFNGSIINETISNGVANPVTFGDDVRIDGRVWRGTTRGPGDKKPFIIDDDLTVKGSITAGSIVGLSSIISAANIATMDDLKPYAKKTSLSSYAKLSALNSYAKQSSLNTVAADLDDVTSLFLAIYEYNRCVVNLSGPFTNVFTDDLEFCWALWVGLPTSASLESAPEALAPQTIDDSKLQSEIDRSKKQKL